MAHRVALVIAYVTVMWLARGRTAQPQPAADVLPGSIEPVPLNKQVILFAIIRAVAVSIAVAIAFGLHLQNADWMPVATLVAMRPSLKNQRWWPSSVWPGPPSAPWWRHFSY